MAGGEIRVDVVKGWRQIAYPPACSQGLCGTGVPGKGAFGKLRMTRKTGPALPRIPAPSGVNCARIRIGTLLSNRALQMLAACSNAISRCSPSVVPVLPPTGATGVGSLNPSPGALMLTMTNCAGPALTTPAERREGRECDREVTIGLRAMCVHVASPH